MRRAKSRNVPTLGKDLSFFYEACSRSNYSAITIYLKALKDFSKEKAGGRAVSERV